MTAAATSTSTKSGALNGLYKPSDRPRQAFGVCIYGQGGCVAGETVIQGPDGDRTIKELAETGLPFRVWALDSRGDVIAATAAYAFRKGVADLYRVTLNDGRSVLATQEHRFLTPSGAWLPLSRVSVGQHLACVDSLLPTNEGNVLSESPEDVRR